MPWVNLDDQFPEHPKVDGLSDGAFRLHVAGICHCNRHLTDGLVERAKVPRLVPRFRRAALDELLQRRMWLPAAGGSAYEIHDYLQWNRPRDEIIAEREHKRKVRSAAGKKGAAARWGEP